MQIICNHCGNQISFPDYQNLIICNHCATHLQIEETKQFYSAKIIEKNEFELLIKYQLSIIEKIDGKSILKDLFELENDLNELEKKNLFYSYTSQKSLPPILSRALFRLSILVFIFIQMIINSDVEINQNKDYLIIAYAFFIGFVGFREFRKWRNITKFKKGYEVNILEIKDNIESFLNYDNPSITVKRLLDKWSDFKQESKEIKSKIFYQKIGFKIYTGQPAISQGFRVFIFFIPLFFLAIDSVGDDTSVLNLIFLIILIMVTLLGIFLIYDGYKYEKIYKAHQDNRDELLKELKEYIER